MESISGRILSLSDRGYTVKEIALELRSSGVQCSEDRVRATLRKANSQTSDSRRLLEVWEMCLRIQAHLEELRLVPKEKIEARMRVIETRDLPHRVGVALDGTISEASFESQKAQ